jgi:GNAT superfamily N-acetyltransferase
MEIEDGPIETTRSGNSVYHRVTHYNVMTIGGQRLKAAIGQSVVEVHDQGHRSVTTNMVTHEIARGRGVASRLLEHAARDAQARGQDLTTTGVFSTSGRAVMERMVAKGHAARQGDNYVLHPKKGGARKAPTTPHVVQRGKRGGVYYADAKGRRIYLGHGAVPAKKR